MEKPLCRKTEYGTRMKEEGEAEREKERKNILLTHSGAKVPN